MAVSIRLLEAIAAIAPFTYRKSDRTTLQRHADMIKNNCVTEIAEDSEKEKVKDRHFSAIKALENA